MGFSSIKDLADSELSGKYTISTFRKIVPSSGGALGSWIDFSVYAGTPKPNFYASNPLESAVLNGNYGIYHGQNVPTSKYVKSVTYNSQGAPPNRYIMCDYLLYYPFIDGDDTAEQPLVNSTPLPRYETGEGVQAVVVSQSAYTGGATYTLNYTNSDGVSGRISGGVVCNTTFLVAGTLLAPQRAECFIPLAPGDKGIRSVEGITFSAPNGGLHSLVLVKPLASINVDTLTTSNEKVFLLDQGTMPEIKNGAYIGFMIFHLGNPGANAIYLGSLETVWGDN